MPDSTSVAKTTSPAARAAPASPELGFAAALHWATNAGRLALLAAFVPYLAGWLPGRVAPAELPSLWTQPLAAFVQRTGAPTGWAWVGSIGAGDSACLIGVAILCAASTLGLLIAVRGFLRRKDNLLAGLCLLQVAVMSFAASGCLST